MDTELDLFLRGLRRQCPYDVMRNFDDNDHFIMGLSDADRYKLVDQINYINSIHNNPERPFFPFYVSGLVFGVIMGGFPNIGYEIEKKGYRQSMPNDPNVMRIQTPWGLIHALAGDACFSKFVLCNGINQCSKWDVHSKTYLSSTFWH